MSNSIQSTDVAGSGSSIVLPSHEKVKMEKQETAASQLAMDTLMDAYDALAINTSHPQYRVAYNFANYVSELAVECASEKFKSAFVEGKFAQKAEDFAALQAKFDALQAEVADLRCTNPGCQFSREFHYYRKRTCNPAQRAAARTSHHS